MFICPLQLCLIMLPFLSCSSHYYFNSFDRDTFTTIVDRFGRCSVFRDQEVIHANVQLSMQKVDFNAVVAFFVDGEPFIAIAGYGKGAGVELRHALTLGVVTSLPYKKGVYCVCINAISTKVFFGTKSGWICLLGIGYEVASMCRACW